MGSLNRFMLARLVANQRVTHLIETGYGEGESSHAALAAGITSVLSCEIFEPLAKKVAPSEQLHVMHSDSVTFLESGAVVQTLAGARCLVFLDAHYPGADHAGERYDAANVPNGLQLPLLDELRLLQGRVSNALVIVDDMRIYRPGFQVAAGGLPNQAPNAYLQEGELMQLLESFASTHSIHWHHEETGYLVLWPLAWGACRLDKWILPGDRTRQQRLELGVAGTTCMSINRRLHDSRFSNRWLVGKGLDIGGGPDSIGLYRNLFPRIQAVTVYDWEQGDAQYLNNVPDNCFDFVYSAHCLEHVADPHIAIGHWLRVLRRGGHLILTVPDEDLYEQGVWPSTFNSDHKHTFTILKQRSWSPVSINVFDLLHSIEVETSIEKIERLDHSFMPGFVRFDQTRTAFSECGIEVVLQKPMKSVRP
jgi:hypothetical protein